MYFFLEDGVHHHLKVAGELVSPKNMTVVRTALLSNEGCFPLVSL